VLHGHDLRPARAEALDRKRRIVKRTHKSSRRIKAAAGLDLIAALAVFITQPSICHPHCGQVSYRHLVGEHLFQTVRSLDAFGRINTERHGIKVWLREQIGAVDACVFRDSRGAFPKGVSDRPAMVVRLDRL
jgi:hypothetical protein